MAPRGPLWHRIYLLGKGGVEIEEGSGEGGLRRQWGRSNAAVMSDACTPNHRLQPPKGPPIPSRNMGRNGSPQQTENAIEWRILPEGRVLFASNPEKDNAQKSFCYLHISLCRKKIMLRAPSCSTWNCDADSSSGNCLAAWQDWQNPRRERIHLIRLPLISSSAFLITWKYALQISTKSQMFNMYASVISILSIGNVHVSAEGKHDETETKYII